MRYTQFTVAFIKAGTENEYRFQVYACNADQALNIAKSRLAKKLGAGEFYCIGEA